MDLPLEHRFTPILACVLLALAGCDGNGASPVETDPASTSRDVRFDQGDEEDDDGRGKGPPVEFADLEIFLEFNSTDNDLGVQVFLDAEGWDRITARDPRGRKVLSFRAQDEVGDLGLTELRFESAEPSPAEVLESIPAGEYEFSGRTVEGGRLEGDAELSHLLPPAPVFTPADGDEVEAEGLTIRWDAVPGLEGYEVIVENEGSGTELFASLGPEATSLTLPPQFVVAGAEYKAEVLAIAENGNKTITEHTFTTR